jgi:pilus assembly protein CpaE
MAIIFEDDDLHVDQIQASINQLATVCRTIQDTQELLGADSEALVVIGPSIPMRQAATLAKTFRVKRPSLGIVVVRDYVSESDMTIALENGIRSIVKSGDATALQEAVTTSLLLSEEMSVAMGISGTRNLSRVITIFSAKGGVGKTTVSVNLASAISKQPGMRVCLVDLDLNFGDVGIFFGKKTQVDLGLLVGSQGILNSNAISGLTVSINNQLDAILSPSTPKIAEALDHERVIELIRVLRLSYDYVILDTDGSFSDLNLDCFEISDEIFVIATPDLPSIKDFSIGDELLESLGISRGKRKLVINRLNNRSGLTRGETESLLGKKADVVIPETHDVLKSINRSTSLVDFRPGNPASKIFRAMAKRFEKTITPIPDAPLATSLVTPTPTPTPTPTETTAP